MRIPTATSMSQGGEDPFDRVLRDTVANDDATPRFDTEPREEQTVTDSEEFVPENDVELERSPRDAEASEELADADVDTSDSLGADPEAEVTESIRRGEPERQETAGKGTDSPRTSTPSAEPLIAAKLQSAPIANAQPTGTVVQNQAAQPQATRTVEPTIRGAGTAADVNKNAPKTQSAQAGYGTRSAASAQMLEQARDSVFKQILMKLNDDGGEMRLRLQPPELGELDLRLTVEGGNKMSLAIASDQRDMMQLLNRHLDELKQTLQQNGLEITDAEVQTRDDFERDQDGTASESGESTTDHDQAEDAASAPQARGYITAEGLDFWA